MPIRIVEVHHCGLRIEPDVEAVEKARAFYGDVLGLQPDPGRPDFSDLPGFWLNAGEHAQIHLMAAEGLHPKAKGPGQDPTLPHIAFAVEDIQATARELDAMDVPYWTLGVLGGGDRMQIFLADPSGNLLELHQADTCRCTIRNRMATGAPLP